MFQKIKQKIKVSVALFFFKRYFHSYTYPFIKSAETVAKLEPFKRLQYYKDARDFAASECFKIELQELIRNFIAEISFKAKDELEITAIRVTLQFIKDFEIRLLTLGSMYTTELKQQQQFNEIMVGEKTINQI